MWAKNPLRNRIFKVSGYRFPVSRVVHWSLAGGTLQRPNSASRTAAANILSLVTSILPHGTPCTAPVSSEVMQPQPGLLSRTCLLPPDMPLRPILPQKVCHHATYATCLMRVSHHPRVQHARGIFCDVKFLPYSPIVCPSGGTLVLKWWARSIPW
jgi:hypothetical protein